MLKRLLKRACQCVGVSSLVLVGNYGDLLGGGADVRMHTPFPVARICYAQIADIFLVALLLFVILSVAARTRYYPWVRLVAAIVIPPYLIQRTQSFFPFDLIEGIVLILLVVWAALLLLLLLRFGKWYRRLVRAGQRDRGVAGSLRGQQHRADAMGRNLEAGAKPDRRFVGVDSAAAAQTSAAGLDHLR